MRVLKEIKIDEREEGIAENQTVMEDCFGAMTDRERRIARLSFSGGRISGMEAFITGGRK